jgi:acyl-coenzyme A thioesterase PaaI-like protein
VIEEEQLSPWPDADDDGRRWPDVEIAPRGGVEYAELHLAQRLLQSRLAGATPPAEVVKDVTERLLEVADALAAYQVPESDRWDGWRPDLPGRGHPLLPPYFIDGETESTLHGRVSFPRFYLGGNGASHGGAQPLVFDDVLGRVMNHHHVGVARTAFLKVNYRRITPLDVELYFDASVDSVDGRKRWGSARLRDADGQLLADAEALFLVLLPGQP